MNIIRTKVHHIHWIEKDKDKNIQKRVNLASETKKKIWHIMEITLSTSRQILYHLES